MSGFRITRTRARVRARVRCSHHGGAHAAPRHRRLARTRRGPGSGAGAMSLEGVWEQVSITVDGEAPPETFQARPAVLRVGARCCISLRRDGLVVRACSPVCVDFRLILWGRRQERRQKERALSAWPCRSPTSAQNAGRVWSFAGLNRAKKNPPDRYRRGRSRNHHARERRRASPRTVVVLNFVEELKALLEP